VAETYPLVLSRHPDARKARLPLFEPLAFGYLALSLGGPVASLCAIYNGLLLRRPGLAIRALVVGLLSAVTFFVTVAFLIGAGMENYRLVRVVGYLVHVLFGALLVASQWRHFRGHRHLGGKVIPLLGAVVAGILLQLALPPKILLLLLGLPL
jgi:chromate transport protein ChrA